MKASGKTVLNNLEQKQAESKAAAISAKATTLSNIKERRSLRQAVITREGELKSKETTLANERRSSLFGSGNPLAVENAQKAVEEQKAGLAAKQAELEAQRKKTRASTAAYVSARNQALSDNSSVEAEKKLPFALSPMGKDGQRGETRVGRFMSSGASSAMIMAPMITQQLAALIPKNSEANI